MAQVTLRDLATNEDIIVPPEGYIFGRVGGDADIQIEDNSISRRQARVSYKGGQWLLETLAVPQGQRAPRPVLLQEGGTFLVGQSEFEVVQVEEDELEEEAPPPRAPPAKAKTAPPKKAPAPANAKTQAAAPPPKKAAPAAAKSAAADAPEEAPPGGIKELFVGVPKGLAYYLVNVPKMLFNPFGTVRTAIEEQPAEPMGRTELIGYALPALVATGVLGSWAAAIAALIAPGHSFQIMLFLPIVPIISGVIGAVITGFVFHPVLNWIINFLKGQSDARSRTNYFLTMMTLSILLAVPNALGVILSAVPYVGLLIGPLLMTLASLVSIYVLYKWFEFFQVVKWFKYVILALGALSVLGGVLNLVSGVRVLLSGVTSTASASVDTPSADDATDEELGDTPPSDPEAAAEWSKKKMAQALAQSEKLQKEAQDKVKKAQADAEAATDDAKPKNDPPAEKVKEEPVAKAEPKNEPVAKNDPPPPTEEEPKAEPVRSNAKGGYAAFARKRDAVEKALEADPTLLKSDAQLKSLYGKYLDDAASIRKSVLKDFKGNAAERARMIHLLEEAELYEQDGKTIDSMASRLKL